VHRLPVLLDFDWRVQRNFAPFRGSISNQEYITDLGNLERRSSNASLVHQLRGIKQAGEIETPTTSQVAPQLRGKPMLPLDPVTVSGRCEVRNPRLPKRRAGINGQQLAELIELEYVFAGVLDNSGRTHAPALMVQEGMPANGNRQSTTGNS
jgi:hypothetical protein